MRLGRLGLREKKPSQGKTERPVLPERLARPVPPVRLEQLAQMDEKAGRDFIAISGLGGQKGGRKATFPLFLFVRPIHDFQFD